MQQSKEHFFFLVLFKGVTVCAGSIMSANGANLQLPEVASISWGQVVSQVSDGALCPLPET